MSTELKRSGVERAAPRKRAVHGVSVGILMLNKKFERHPGDVGNAMTWSFPVQYRVVPEAVGNSAQNLHKVNLLEPFKKAAQELIDLGVDGITTTCGFLSIYQKELAEFCSVPVATSSLLQVPMVQRLIPASKRVGILTYSSESLTAAYLEAVGVAADTPVTGMPEDCSFVRAMREEDYTVSIDAKRDDVLNASARLLTDNPGIGAIVLECTNLSPFSADISEQFGIPVFDIVSMVNWFHTGLRPRRY